MGGACCTNEERRDIYWVLMGEPEGKRSLRRPKRRWKYNIEMDPKGLGFGSMVWIDLSEDRDRRRALVSAVMNLRVS